jgi:tetratricopeptide (TPR) repeat protein
MLSPVPRLLAGAFALAIACAAAGAEAQTARATQVTPAPDAKARALALYRESRDHYRDGRFAEAAALLERAYTIYPEAVLLYNLGRAYEGLGKLTEAIDAYQRYLAAEPEAADRGAIERRVKTLRQQQARIEAAKKTPPPPPPPPPRGERREVSWVPWVIAGAGVAVLAAGIGVGVQARGRSDDAAAEPDALLAEALHDDATDLATTANVLFAVGGAVTLAGGIWGIVDVATQPGPRVKLGVGTTRLTLSATF